MTKDIMFTPSARYLLWEYCNWASNGYPVLDDFYDLEFRIKLRLMDDML